MDEKGNDLYIGFLPNHDNANTKGSSIKIFR